MSPRPTLTLRLGLLAAVAALTVPGLAAAGGGRVQGGAAPTLKYAAPLMAETEGKRAKGEAVPSEQKAPPPAPSGCPLRDGKLELIV